MKGEGLPVPAMHDRASSHALPQHRAQAQAAFVAVLVLPLWRTLAGPVFSQLLDASAVTASLDDNLARCVAIIRAGAAGGGAEQAAAGTAAGDNAAGVAVFGGGRVPPRLAEAAAAATLARAPVA
jgi:hypothetical protein